MEDSNYDNKYIFFQLPVVLQADLFLNVIQLFKLARTTSTARFYNIFLFIFPLATIILSAEFLNEKLVPIARKK